jgi:predicted PurR-regulated permease PerM
VLATDAHPVRHRIEIAPKTIFLILGVIAGVWVLSRLTTVLSVMTVALVLVGTLDPLVAWLERRGIGRGRSLILVFLVASVALAGVVLLMVPPLLVQALRIVEGAPKARESVIHSLQGYQWAKPMIGAINDLPLDNLVASSGTPMIGYST